MEYADLHRDERCERNERWAFDPLTPAEQAEYDDGVEAGADSAEGDQPPELADTPYGAGWRAGHDAARRMASDAADQAEAEIAEALGIGSPADDDRLAGLHADAADAIQGGHASLMAPGTTPANPTTHYCRGAQDNAPLPADDRVCRWCGRTGGELRETWERNRLPVALIGAGRVR